MTLVKDRLAAVMDDIVGQHYPYITAGQMAPHWIEAGEGGSIYRHYNMTDGVSPNPFVGLAIALTPAEQELRDQEFREFISKRIIEAGPMPSKAEWEAKN